MLEVNIEVKMKSGAVITLSPEQNETVARWVEGLVLSGVTSKPKNTEEVKVKKKSRTWTPWTESELQDALKLGERYPANTRGRSEAVRSLARKMGRTPGAVDMMIRKMAKEKEKDSVRAWQPLSSLKGGSHV